MRSTHREAPSFRNNENRLVGDKGKHKIRGWQGALVPLIFSFFTMVPSTQAASLFGGEMDLFKGEMDLFEDKMDLFEGSSLMDIWTGPRDSAEEHVVTVSDVLDKIEWPSGSPGQRTRERVEERIGDLGERLRERFEHRWGESSGPPEAVVPLPPALLLFGSALGFLVGVGKRRLKVFG